MLASYSSSVDLITHTSKYDCRARPGDLRTPVADPCETWLCIGPSVPGQVVYPRLVARYRPVGLCRTRPLYPVREEQDAADCEAWCCGHRAAASPAWCGWRWCWRTRRREGSSCIGPATVRQAGVVGVHVKRCVHHESRTPSPEPQSVRAFHHHATGPCPLSPGRCSS
ncbi:hypothetical protein FA15DRAFT_300712 [Coprinopsis marcescibilis]|uniref:Uncharacterized protein n=1 Tax=Coprinopsis marcescibilis TaxID=230819 RepID=A0A5C3KCT4_COPMA|nr:hypothetical protein FA15DRAFT_300712 [Coprinopsis marcescibilis]